jgi:hypothetical protein
MFELHVRVFMERECVPDAMEPGGTWSSFDGRVCGVRLIARQRFS